MNRITLASLRLWSITIAVCLPTAVQAELPPNLVVILTDDQGYADVGFNGCEDIPTPNLDRLAASGAVCTDGYVTYAVCGPSRAGLITGRYQDRFGACRNPTIDPTVPNNGVPCSEKNLAELLRPVGYTSMAVGKWHLGTHPDLHPRVRGFDEFFGFLSGGHEYFPEKLVLEDLSEVRNRWGWYRTKLRHNGKPVTITNYLTDELSGAAVDFIDRHADDTFFLYLAYNAPHTPLQATKKYLDRFTHIEDPKRKTYAAMVSAVDDGVGRVIDAIRKHDISEQTIVFFLSDNGGATNNASQNTPLRGHKSDPHEGGIRVPFAVTWPGKIPAGTIYQEPVSSLDIAATIVAHSHATVSDDKPLDGVDLVPYLKGEIASPPHSELFWRWHDRGDFAARIGDSKLIVGKSDEGQGDTQLFDLQKDIAESTDLASEYTNTVTAIQTALKQWSEDLVAPLAPRLGSWNPAKNPRKFIQHQH